MRRADWVARLNEVIERSRHATFSYGRHDCGHFGAACVEAVTGERFEMPYHGRLSAARWVHRGGGVAARITERLGPPATGRPRRGDVCLVATEDGEGIGVAYGGCIAVLASHGLDFLPMTASLQHWRT